MATELRHNAYLSARFRRLLAGMLATIVMSGLFIAPAALAVEPDIGPYPGACPEGTPDPYPPRHDYCLRTSEYGQVSVSPASVHPTTDSASWPEITMTLTLTTDECNTTIALRTYPCVEFIHWMPATGENYRLITSQGTFFSTDAFGARTYYQPFGLVNTTSRSCIGGDPLPSTAMTCVQKVGLSTRAGAVPASWAVLIPQLTVRLSATAGDVVNPYIETAMRILQDAPTNTAPIADFTFNRDQGDLGLFHFQDNSTDANTDTLTAEWDFGDGGTDSGLAPNHAYAAPGSYDVTLTVTDPGGLSDSITKTVDVAAPTLGVAVDLLDGAASPLDPDEHVRVQVTVSAASDGLDALSELTFPEGVVIPNPSTSFSQVGTPVPEPDPAGFTLEPGTTASFTVELVAAELGEYAIGARVTGVDAGGQAVEAENATIGVIGQQLQVTITPQANPVHLGSDFAEDSFDVAVEVTNTDIVELTSVHLDGGLEIVGVPSGASVNSQVVAPVPDGQIGTLAPGASATLTFRLQALRAGSSELRALVLADDGSRTVSAVGRVTLDVVGDAIVVNSAGDAGDAESADGSCDTGSAILRDGGQEPECTLRAAIEAANATDALDTIEFDVPDGPATIQPQSPLPTVTQPLVVDGRPQPGTTIDGGAAGTGANGLTIAAAATVRGLHVTHFDGAGIDASGQGPQASVILLGNVIGAASPGSIGNRVGVRLGALGDTVGGPDPEDANAISGNQFAGVWITAYGDVIGNRIGTDASGAQPVPNGVGVLVDEAQGVSIRDNVISGNDRWGLRFVSLGEFVSTPFVDITGNLVGLAADGATALGNGGNPGEGQASGGMWISDRITVGGDQGRGNVISGNVVHADESGLGGAVVLTGDGVSHRFVGNFVGTDAGGSKAVPNTGNGVVVDCARCQIGEPGSPNVISGNSGVGLVLRFQVGQRMEANLVGVDVTGSEALPNQRGGVDVQVGNSCQDDRVVASNVVSGNVGYGVKLYRPVEGLNCTHSPSFEGNIIGLDREGAAPVPNEGAGLWVDASTYPIDFQFGRIDRTTNTVSGNHGDGFLIEGEHAWGGVSNAFVGTTSSGGCAGECPGNSGSGVHVRGVIAGDGEDQHVEIVRSTVAGNGGDGVLVVRSTLVFVNFNFIGTDRSMAQQIGNGRDGIRFDSSDGAANANRIFNNFANGVSVVEEAASSPDATVSILDNYFDWNRGLPIDLGNDGPTANHVPGFFEDGPNHFLNYPVIEKATLKHDGEWLEVEGRLNAPTHAYRLEFFSAAQSPFANCGRVPLGIWFVSTDLTQSTHFHFTLPDIPQDADLSRVAATATRTQVPGDLFSFSETSELSDCLVVSDAVTTNLSADAAAGATRVAVESNDGFVGKVVDIGSGATIERNFVVAQGSLILAVPLRFAHAAGEPVTVVDEELFVSVDRSSVKSVGGWTMARVAGTIWTATGASVACGEDVSLALSDLFSVGIDGSKLLPDGDGRCRYTAASNAGMVRFRLDPLSGRWAALMLQPTDQLPTGPLQLDLEIGGAGGSAEIQYTQTATRWVYRRLPPPPPRAM